MERTLIKRTLPHSGMEVTLRRPGMLSLRKAYGFLPVLKGVATEAAARTAMESAAEGDVIEVGMLIAVAAAVDPKFCIDEPPEGSAVIWFDDLQVDDARALIRFGGEAARLNQEVADAAPLSGEAERTT